MCHHVLRLARNFFSLLNLYKFFSLSQFFFVNVSTMWPYRVMSNIYMFVRLKYIHSFRQINLCRRCWVLFHALSNVKFLISSLCAVIRFTAWGIICCCFGLLQNHWPHPWLHSWALALRCLALIWINFYPLVSPLLHGFRSLLFPLWSLQLRNKVQVVASEDLEKFLFHGVLPGERSR